MDNLVLEFAHLVQDNPIEVPACGYNNEGVHFLIADEQVKQQLDRFAFFSWQSQYICHHGGCQFPKFTSSILLVFHYSYSPTGDALARYLIVW